MNAATTGNPKLYLVAGTSIHVTEHSEGPRVVLVHGSAQGSRVGGAQHFANQAGLMARGWTVVTPDRPGHGFSPAPDRGDDAALDEQWVSELLGQRGHLVGHSFGSAFDAVAIRTAELGCGRREVISSPHHFPQNVSDEFNDLLDATMRSAGQETPQ